MLSMLQDCVVADRRQMARTLRVEQMTRIEGVNEKDGNRNATQLKISTDL